MPFSVQSVFLLLLLLLITERDISALQCMHGLVMHSLMTVYSCGHSIVIQIVDNCYRLDAPSRPSLCYMLFLLLELYSDQHEV